jgi:hypothetical protein
MPDNDLVTSARQLASRAGATAVVSALAIALVTGCGGSGDDEADQDQPTAESSTTEGTTSAGPVQDYLPVPEGVTLTEPGAALGFGDRATIAWRPRQDTVVALDLTVERIDRTTFEESFDGWVVTPEMRRQVPYFVRVEVANVGERAVGRLLVPLYGYSAASTMYEPLDFREQPFEPCPGGNLPERVAPAESVELCFVYLLPEDQQLAAAAFDPLGDLPPVTWTGTITEIEKPEKKPDKKGDKKGDQKGDQGDGSGDTGGQGG